MFVPTLNGKACCDTSQITELVIGLDDAFTDCETLPGLLASAHYNSGHDYSGPLPTVPMSIEEVSCGEENAELSIAAGGYHYNSEVYIGIEDEGISILFG